MLDPLTGEIRDVQLGSPRRLRTIFNTNLRMAYARGRWQRIERTAEARPWLPYVAVLDARTRPEHLSWHGAVLPWDHEFWRTHYPPCGWYCRCTVMQLSADDLEAFGFAPSAAPPDGWDETRPWVDRRNDRTVQVPVGIDPGFQHNPGLIDLGREAADRTIARIDAAPPSASPGGRGRSAASWSAAKGTHHGDFAIAIAPERVLAAIGGRSPTVRLSAKTAAKQGARPAKSATWTCGRRTTRWSSGSSTRANSSGPDRGAPSASSRRRAGSGTPSSRRPRTDRKPIVRPCTGRGATTFRRRANGCGGSTVRRGRIGAGRTTTPALARRHESIAKCFRRQPQASPAAAPIQAVSPAAPRAAQGAAERPSRFPAPGYRTGRDPV